MLDEARTGFGIVPGAGEPVKKGDFLRSIPFMLAMGLLTGVAQSIGGDFHDGTFMGYGTSTGVSLLIMIPLGLLASRLHRGHPGTRRTVWTVMLVFVLTMNMNDSTGNALAVKLAVMGTLAFMLALLPNRLTVGSWFPSRQRG